jgi:hypothetical protein
MKIAVVSNRYGWRGYVESIGREKFLSDTDELILSFRVSG